MNTLHFMGKEYKKPDTPLELVREARALYAQAPAHPPAGVNSFEGHCMMTALGTAGNIMVTDIDVTNPAYHAVRAQLGEQNMIEYNATHSTDEVLDAFDRAALYLDEVECKERGLEAL